MEQVAIPKTLNCALAGLILAAMALQMFVLPLLGLGPMAMGLAILALIPLNTPFWSLIHEAIHKNFVPDNKANLYAGRLMAVAFGASFHILRFGHLMHHQYNRDWESKYTTLLKNTRLRHGSAITPPCSGGYTPARLSPHSRWRCCPPSWRKP
jgi:fatty acid desaturase